MSDGESEKSDGFFGIDSSTKENKNDVEGIRKALCPLQPCYFAKWDIFADTSDCQYAMGFPVCILDNFLPILPISCHLLMSE
jgi:hypothetical protein